MRRGQALIETRKRFGNQGSIRSQQGFYRVGTDDGSGITTLGAGSSWEAAFQDAAARQTIDTQLRS